MKRFDVFNGDADGICALHQWRLAFPCESILVTGVKREIQLLDRVMAGVGDEVTIFDVSLESNRNDVKRLLEAGASLRYFDHHFAGEAIDHPALECTIDTSPDVCTSLLVDKALAAKYRAWAVVAAFGDNFQTVARRKAANLAVDEIGLTLLAELGELLNYNSYGDSIADLHFSPDELYRQLAPYQTPFDFIRVSPAFEILRKGFHDDMAKAEALSPCLLSSSAAAWLLPDDAWARRVIGVMANRLAVTAPGRAHAMLVPNASGTLTVSVRAPRIRPTGADEFCRRFPTGGGRKAAAGVNRLPEADIDIFIREFTDFFSAENSSRPEGVSIADSSPEPPEYPKESQTQAPL